MNEQRNVEAKTYHVSKSEVSRKEAEALLGEKGRYLGSSPNLFGGQCLWYIPYPKNA